MTSFDDKTPVSLVPEIARIGAIPIAGGVLPPAGMIVVYSGRPFRILHEISYDEFVNRVKAAKLPAWLEVPSNARYFAISAD